MAVVTEALVVGGSGLLGSALMTEFAAGGTTAAGTFCDNQRASLVRLDLNDTGAIGRLLGELAPRVVINTAAESNVDLCEREPERSHRANVESAVNLALGCRKAGARLVSFSSDYVFGSERGPYDDGHTPAPMNTYGRHKLEAEHAVAEALADHLVVRVCNLYGYHPGGKNFVMGLLARLRAGEPLRVPLDQWGSPTLVSDLASAVTVAAFSELRGTVHMAGPDNLDRLSFATRAAELLGFKDAGVEGVRTSELVQAAKRPLRGGLVTSAAVEGLGLRFRGIDEGLLHVRAAMEAAPEPRD